MNIKMTANHSNVIESVNSVHLPEHYQTDDSDCFLLHNNVQSRNNNFSNTPIIPSANDEQDIRVVMKNSEDTYQQDWIAEPDINEQKVVNSEFQQLLALNEQLRQDNSDLYNQVERLKTELVEMEKILQWQKTRSTVSESMFNQQNQELSAANEQIQSLYQQLDQSVQTVQRQDIIIETYKSQLQISQHRLAQLERECSLLQTNYAEESQQLLHSENTCRELRTRLMRQQRQTLQFKAALEKCLDKPVVHEDIIEDHFPVGYNNNNNHRQTRFSRKAHSMLNNPQPIQPWSVDLEDTIITESSENIPVAEIPIYQVSENTTFNNRPSVNLPTVNLPDTNLPTVNLPDTNLPTVNLPDSLIEEVVKELSQVQELSSIADTTSNYSPVEHEEIEDFWLDSSSTREVVVTNSSLILPEAIKEKQEEKQETISMQQSPSQSPSPLIYPQRPPKGRKSLASVELPNFRPKTE